jgi:hypothetical protein
MLIWKRELRKYGDIDVGYLGAYKVFTVAYDGFTSRESENKHKLVNLLPGMKPTVGHFKNQEQAMMKAEVLYDEWLKSAGLVKI